MMEEVLNPHEFNVFLNGLTIVLVYRPASSASTNDTLASFQDCGSVSFTRIGIDHASSTNVRYSVCQTSSSTCPAATATGVWTSPDWYRLAFRHNTDSTVDVFVNGTKQSTTTAIPVPWDITRQCNDYGFARGTSNYFWGDLAEIVLFNQPLSDASMAGIDNYLRQRYGL
jgi:hypothetical protein